MLKRKWNEIGPAKWKIPFHSTYENFGKSNRKFWWNGTGKEAQNSASAAAVLKQVLSGQAAQRGVILINLNLAGSLKCGWLILSGFLCENAVVFCPKLFKSIG